MRIVPLRTQSPQLHGRTHVHGWKGCNTLQQWCRPQYFSNNSSSHAICSGGSIGCPLHQRKTAILMCQRLSKLGHPQPLTPMQTNMQQHMRYSPTKYCQKHSRPWTCTSTGYGAAMHKVDLAAIGDPAHRTWQTTSPSITQLTTTNLSAPQFYHLSTITSMGKQVGNGRWRQQCIKRQQRFERP
jgi:hypothetical protein